MKKRYFMPDTEFLSLDRDGLLCQSTSETPDSKEVEPTYWEED